MFSGRPQLSRSSAPPADSSHAASASPMIASSVKSACPTGDPDAGTIEDMVMLTLSMMGDQAAGPTDTQTVKSVLADSGAGRHRQALKDSTGAR